MQNYRRCIIIAFGMYEEYNVCEAPHDRYNMFLGVI